jgi:glyoxylase-like metal-dependent hydrolase (beta-lactamase superfamily II)
VTEAIDLLHLGRDRVICCWRVGDALVDPGPSSCVDTLLEALDGWEPRRLLLTHIHLDHAGASGTLAERWPDLEVWVHERGARHMVDPEKLVASARRLYGEDMDRLWGEFRPVPEERLHILTGGETLDGGWEVAYTPGHASHHVSYLHDGTAFVGDVGGVRIPPVEFTVPPTPPPDIDLEAWHASIDTVAAWRPDRLALTHFGGHEDVLDQLGEVSRRLDAWAAVARVEDEAGFVARITDEIERGAAEDLDTAASFIQAAPPDQLYAGLARYWAKRA